MGDAHAVGFWDRLSSALTIFLSAVLLFLVQPIIARVILPWFGGSAAVWTSCLVFFQVALLAGYLYAHALTRIPRPRHQALLHVALLLASLLVLPITPHLAQLARFADPTLAIAWILLSSVGLPYFALSATGPLLQYWLSREPAAAARQRSVYRLFALSNLGSLVGLLAYPFVIEPELSTRMQCLVWSSAYALFVLACATCAWRFARVALAALPASGQALRPAPGNRQRLYWIGCAALGSALLLAVTNHVTQNLATIPLLWVAPLALYLVSFILSFEGRSGKGWYNARLIPLISGLLCAAMAWSLSQHNAVPELSRALPLFAIGLLFGCWLCHGELARTKPDTLYLTDFYRCVALGGALGGMGIALIAPRVFDAYWETPIALVLCAVLALFALSRSAPARGVWPSLAVGLAGVLSGALVLCAGGGIPGFNSGRLLDWMDLWGIDSAFVPALGVGLLVLVAARLRLLLLLPIAYLVCTLGFGWKYYQLIVDETEYLSRDFYGALRVKHYGTGQYEVHSLTHGVIMHGEQFVMPELANLPTTYYGPTSGLGRAMRMLHAAGGPITIGSIGLGTGTTAAWAQAGDRMRIYEIDPQVVRIARTRFHYLADSAGKIEVVLGDARLSLAGELAAGRFANPAERFDVLAVDAFSSDAIPVHLMTREALAIYRQAIKPEGIIAFHISNRYLDLAPVLANLAADAGLRSYRIEDSPEDAYLYARTDWVLLTADTHLADDPAFDGASRELAADAKSRVWSDQFNNLLGILR